MKMFTIHNVDSNWNKKYEENKVNNEDILTLDDGLYSQYKYLDKIVNNKNKKIFSITPNLLLKPNQNQCTSEDKRLNKLGNDWCEYMSLEQVYAISKIDNCFIGMHGYNHIRFKKLLEVDKLSEEDVIRRFIRDLDLCFSWFKDHKLNTDIYCFPYNFTFNRKFVLIIQEKYPEIKTFINGGRISW